MHCDDENIKGITNVFYRFLTTVVVKNVIIRICNKLEHRARQISLIPYFACKTNRDLSKEIGRNSITTGYIVMTNTARSFYSIIK